MLGLALPVKAMACEARDFLMLALPEKAETRSALALALETAYDGVRVEDAKGHVMIGPKRVFLGDDAPRSPQEVLAYATVRDQFRQVYPLDFDLEERRIPWNDPGRARDAVFFKTLYFDNQAAVARSLEEVRFAPVGTRYLATNKHCVSVQLEAALREIETLGPEVNRYLSNVGGSFNWRRIAGTERLSVHSFGIAVDLNAELGGYWRWNGETPGAVGGFANKIPAEIVSAFERRGFIWGGKWHHYDGMHFEYRPELILYSRLVKDR